MILNIVKDKIFYFLWLISVFGAIAVLPYTTAQTGIKLTMTVLVVTLIQGLLLYAVVTFFGIRFARKSNFKIVSSKECVKPSIVSGLTVGLILKFSDQFIFKHHANILLNNLPDINVLYRILASFYGAINEEVLLRLFGVSLVALLLQKFTKLSKNSVAILSIILCALLFAVGHLPMLYKMVVVINTYDIVRVLILNGFAGITFGVLYWRYGLMASMLSHFIADLVIHVF